MKKKYESPSTEFIELDAQNVLLDSWTGDAANEEQKKGSGELPELGWD